MTTSSCSSSVCGVNWRPYLSKTWKQPSWPGYTTSDACWIIVESLQLQSQMPMLGGLQLVLVHALFSKLDLHSKYKHEEDLPPYTFYTFDKNGISLLVLYRFCMFTCIMLSHIHLTIKVHNPSLFISL